MTASAAKATTPAVAPVPNASQGSPSRPGPDAGPWIVAIEASTTATSVALADLQGRLLAEHWIDGPRAASERLLPSLDALARAFGFAPGQARECPGGGGGFVRGVTSASGARGGKDASGAKTAPGARSATALGAGAVAAVAVSHGPGGFTGLRVGLALAKTVARAWDARLYGFSTLEALAARWPVPGDVVCAALDARRGEVYAGAYRIGAAGERPALLLADAVESAPSLGERLKVLLARLRTELWAAPSPSPEIAPPTIWLGGSGARRYRDVLAEALGEAARWIPNPLGDPAAGSLAILGAAMLRAGDAGVDPLAIAPVYLRPSDAEKRHGIDVTTPILPPEGADASSNSLGSVQG